MLHVKKSKKLEIRKEKTTQWAFTCSKWIVRTLGKGFKICSKLTIKTPGAALVSSLTLTDFIHCSIGYRDKGVNVQWGSFYITFMGKIMQTKKLLKNDCLRVQSVS